MPRLTMLRPRVATLDTSIAAPPPKMADSHYGTPEHKAWVRQVLARAGGRCQGPDCSRSGVRLFADHIVEKRDGGSLLDPANGQALCGSCHTIKTNRERARRVRGEG